MCSEKATSNFKQLKRSYGFDEVAIVPGDVTINPDQTSTDFQVGDITFSIPIVTSAMDGVVDVDFAILMAKFGGMAVLNLDGVQARYDNPAEILAEIRQRLAGPDEHHIVTTVKEPLTYKMGTTAVSESLTCNTVYYLRHARPPQSWSSTVLAGTPRYVRVFSIISAATGDATAPPV